MEIKINVECSLSPTGTHNLTLALGEAGGRHAQTPNAFVKLTCECSESDPAVAIADSAGQPVCLAFRRRFLAYLRQSNDNYSAREEYKQDLAGMLAEHRNTFDLIETAIMRGSIGPRQLRSARAALQDKPARPTSRKGRWAAVLRSVTGRLVLHYNVSVSLDYCDHKGNPGLAIQLPSVGPGPKPVAIFAPTGERRAYVYRAACRHAAAKVNAHKHKPSWCCVCAAPIRGLERHASSVGHRAVVRRDMFRLARALFPGRTVRELGGSTRPQEVAGTEAYEERWAQ